jgi:hypothetical protein
VDGCDQPVVHCAYFHQIRIDNVTTGPEAGALITEFRSCWNGRVTKTREMLAVAGEITGALRGLELTTL